MTRVVFVLGLALAGCAAINANTGRPVPMIVAHGVDMALFAAGACVGMNAQFGSYSETRTEQMAVGYGVALAAWLPYWFVETQ